MPKFLWYFIKKQWKYVLGFVVVAFLFSGVMVISSYFLSKTLGILPYTLKEGQWDKFLYYIKFFIILEILTIILSIIHTITYTKFRWYMNIFIRLFGVDRMIELDYSNLAKLGSWKLLQIVKNWVDAYSYLIYDGIDIISETIFELLLLISILWYFNLRFVVVFLFWLLFIGLCQKIIYRKLTQLREKERELNENYTKQTAKIFMNFILLKIANLKEKELNKLYQIWEQRVNNYVWLKFWFSAWSRLMNFFMTIVFVIVLIYFWSLYLKWQIKFDLILWISILFMFTRRMLGRMSFFISELAEKWTYIERFDSLIEREKPEEALKKSEEKNNLSDFIWDIFSDFISVKFENIWFKYEDQKLYLFEWFNFSFKNWEKIAILGKSGSWKSTLFKMLVRLVEPEKGSIKIITKISEDKVRRLSEDNLAKNCQMIDLKEIEPEIIYQKIWYFYQEPLVFDWTIRENLTLWLVDVDDKKLKEVLKIIELDHLSLDTIIGERWVLLSGWERQRLALWRAFIFDYEILLLDEPTSNLDLYLEKKILNEIFKRYKNKTILVVSHRPYVLKNVDRVVVMKKWEIILDTYKIDDILNKLDKYFQS